MIFHKYQSPQFVLGEMVRVKAKDQILESLLTSLTQDGLLFTDQMWYYCGNSYPVLRVVDHFFDEKRKRTYRTKSPLYVLDNIICKGKLESLQFTCDRACFLLWHENWLEKI